MVLFDLDEHNVVETIELTDILLAFETEHKVEFETLFSRLRRKQSGRCQEFTKAFRGYNLGTLYFVGVVSWGSVECPVGTNYPVVYARVTSQLLWIKKHISGTTCPKPIL